ncbi:Anaphase-promoting complex subunit 7 [Camellia lanceoleosa]|uniref:Anaphase-promoting complex subunit 7 n=1 Tax=Camellia lanceoleosa TaxID=1840588 RepID=A0ACC0HFN6_9ERIC|nr:Anaphase-promoting complex subunit 7 [Camellia lanceoleosa]
MNLMMGKLYRNSRHTRSSIACYKECLRHCPYFIEAIIALAELGVASKDIISLFPQNRPDSSSRGLKAEHAADQFLKSDSLMAPKAVAEKKPAEKKPAEEKKSTVAEKAPAEKKPKAGKKLP